MIPKIIHYIWLGGTPLTELGEKCLESWKKYCPDFQIICWNESNFDINQNRYCKEAWQKKKYAFVSDYIRLYVLFNYGGIYMDTDVELLKPLERFLKHKAFLGFEGDFFSTALMGSEKKFPLFKEFLDDYHERIFIKENGKFNTTTNVIYIYKKCLQKGFKPDDSQKVRKFENLTLYPTDYFCPKDWRNGELTCLTENTVCIHHFAASWLTQRQRNAIFLMNRYRNKFGRWWRIPFSLVHPVLALEQLYKKFKFRQIIANLTPR